MKGEMQIFEVSDNAIRVLRHFAERYQMSTIGDTCRYAADKLEEARAESAKLNRFIVEVKNVCEDPMNRGGHTTRQMCKFLDDIHSKALGVLSIESRMNGGAGITDLGHIMGIRIVVSDYMPNDMLSISPESWKKLRGWIESSMLIVRKETPQNDNEK